MHSFIQGSEANPLAGVEVAVNVNTTDSFRLLTLRAKLVTSAAVANRFPHFQVVDQSGNIVHEIVTGVAQTAGVTTTYDLITGSAAGAEWGVVNDGVAVMSLPDYWFPAGYKIITKTTALDVGDEWSSIVFTGLVGDEFEHLKLLERIAAQYGA